jgi:hypothetical protein
MKKNTFILLAFFMGCLSFVSKAQTLNQDASWPNANWTLSGTYTAGGLLSDPTAAGTTLTWDDDVAGNGAADNVIATSPVIDLTSANGAGETWITVSGDYVYRELGGDVLIMETYDADAATWSTLQTFSTNSTNTDYRTCAGTAAYTTAVLDVSGFTATQLSGFQYRISYNDLAGWQWGWCLTSPTITSTAPPSCLDPTALTATNITVTSADLGWTENGTATAWDVEIIGSGIAATGTPTASGVTNPYGATGLTQDTLYDFYVRADCGSRTSNWVGPFTFRTACSALTTPYTEDFETFTPANNVAFSAENCWTASSGIYFWELAPGTDGGSSGTGPDPSITTGNYFYTEASNGTNGDITELVSPLFDLSPLTTPALAFDYHMFGGETGTLDVLVNGTTVVWTRSGQQQTTATQAWEKATVGLSAYAGQTISVTFRATSAGTFEGDMAIDNVSFDELPSCTAPSTLTATNITDATADLGWAENGTATLWDVEVLTSGTPATGTPTASGITNPYAASGFAETTSYDFYVRADCGGAGTSDWAGPFTFSTTETCPTPSALNVTNIMETSADLGWTENGTATLWNIEIVDLTAGGTVTGTPTATGVTANPYNAALVGDNSYQFYVQADCGVVDGTSEWAGPFAFNTPYVAVPPTCSNGIFLDSGGTSSDYSSGENITYTICPDNPGDVVTVEFTSFSTENDGTENCYDGLTVHDGADATATTVNPPAGGSIWCWNRDLITPIGTGDLQGMVLTSTSPSGCLTFVFTSDGSVQKEGWEATVSCGAGPSCLAPSALTATNISATAADLGWTENGTATLWDIQWGAAGFDQATEGTLISDTADNPYSLGGLSPETDYEYYVRADCGASNGESSWAGPFDFSTLESCVAPTALTATNISTTAADLGWTENGTTALWDIQWGAAGFDQATEGTLISDTADNPYSLGSLSPETDYEYYVRADCGASDGVSAWAGPFSFTTPCATEIPDYNEDFTTYIPDCWSVAGDGDLTTGPSGFGSSSWVAEEFGHQSTSGNGAVNINLFTTGRAEWVISPTIDLSAGNYRVAIDVALTNFSSTAADNFGSDDEVVLAYSADNGATWSRLITWDAANQPPAAGETSTFNLVSQMSSTAKFAMWATDGLVDDSEDYDFHFDNFVVETIPSCLAPTDLAAGSITADSASLSWTENGTATAWDIQWGAAGFDQATEGTLINDTADNPYSLGSLSSNTDYEYYVRADCGASDGVSAWAGPFSFTTLCAPETAPYTMNFSATSTPDCWSESGSEAWRFSTGAGFGATGAGDHTPGGGTNYAWIDGSSPSGPTQISTLTSVPVDVSGITNPRISFWVFSNNTSTSDYNTLEVEVYDGAAWNAAYTNQASLGAEWFNVLLDLSSFTITGNVQIRFTITENSPVSPFQNDILIDDVSFEEAPTCLAPTALTATNISATAADLGWTENNTATSWEVQYGVDGFDQATEGTTVTTANNPYNLSGLDPTTAYDYYVRSNCGSGDGDSAWAGPFSFTTPCAVYNSGYTEDFTTFIPNCWTEAAGMLAAPTTFTSTTFSSWTGDGFGNNGTSGAARINIYGGSVDEWLISPSLALTGNDQISFDVAYTDFNNTGVTEEYGVDDVFAVIISTDNGLTWSSANTLRRWDNAGSADSFTDFTTTGSNFTIDLSSYSGTVKVAFYSESTVSNADSDLSIDNFAIENLPPTGFVYDGTSWNNVPEGNITASDDLIVMSGTIALSSAISANNVIVMDGATLTAANGVINVNGDLTNDGVINGTGRTIFNGSVAQTINGSGSMVRLEVNNTNGVTLNGNQDITTDLRLIDGILTTVGSLTMKSTAAGTAFVSNVSSTSGVSGNVTVERFIPAGNRAFRFLGAGTSGQSVFDAWQEAGDNSNGFGMHVTGTSGTVGTNNATTGHDETVSGNSSMFKWDSAAQNWAAVTNTKTEVLATGAFYRTLVRGNRTSDLSSNTETPTDVTLRSTGTLATGNQMITGTAGTGTFLAMANPYQSKVNVSLATRSNISDNMYYWDPTLNTQGAYTTIDITSAAAGTNGDATVELEPGQGVFLQETAGASSIMFAEDDKVSGSGNVGILSTPNGSQLLRVKLYHTNQLQAGGNSIDGLIMRFNSSENMDYDFNDAIKFTNIDENMAISHSSGNLLAIEKRPAPVVNETINLNMTQYRSTNYSFTASVETLIGLKAYVKDNLDGSLTEIIQGGSDTQIDFTVDANNPVSIDANRFQIVFETVTLGMGDELASSISMYPNPVTAGQLNVQLNSAASDDLSVMIFNSIGQQISDIQVETMNNNLVQINGLDQFAQGVYFVKVTNDGKEFTSKFIIK